MFRVIFDRDRQRVPIRVWARKIDEETERQLQRLANQPWVIDHVCAMADAHVSSGIAVGSVFATERTIVPRALGGDLGCGMSAVRFSTSANPDRNALERLVRDLARAIPVGDAMHRGRGADVSKELFSKPLSTRALEHDRERLLPRHLGTLGGGNHFIEIDRDADGSFWLLVHSGSRGLGAAIASHHVQAAESKDDSELAGLDVSTEEGAAYLADVSWALDFARANRNALRERALAVLRESFHEDIFGEEAIDIHHNFVAEESWRGRNVHVHRKGAVAVPKGTAALIPGSMGTASYVVEGLGSEDAFGSCSHGAGRIMSRKEARTTIRPAAFEQSMRRVVYPAGSAKQLIEEAPGAYRDITEVLDDQRDLVRRITRLEPVAVLKG
jgi:tRNA-splicing ligase RtcB